MTSNNLYIFIYTRNFISFIDLMINNYYAPWIGGHAANK